MKKLFAVAAVAVAVPLLLSGTGGAVNGHASPIAVCPAVPVGEAHCDALVAADSKGNPQATSSPTGYGPAQFHGAYNLPTTTSAAQTIAIVDAYDDPTVASDLNTYDAAYGLTCNGCLTKVNQNGGTNYPRADQGWALEISLDVQTAHEICQSCRILLVEAKTNSFSNLLAAEDEAVKLGATEISNSYGGSESSSDTTYDSHFNHPGLPITVSSGDNGYGVEYPASSQYVTAVGGTTLTLGSNNTYGGESAWSSAGSGCSAYDPKPSWQKDTGCSMRTVADVSADADPNTGASVYDSYGYQGQKGWFQVGGTSLSSPLIASVYALAGNGVSTSYGSYPYAHSSYLHDVTSGSNGSCGTYLCNAGSGYDGPTGLGTPNGTGGF